MRTMTVAAFAAAFVMGGAAVAQPTWPQAAHDAGQTWRNPDETTLTAANVAKLKLVSSQQPGYVSAGPVTLQDGSLYLCSDMLGLGAIDATTGNQRWSNETLGGPCSAPALAAGTAYTTAYYYGDDWVNSLSAVDTSDGNLRWQVSGPPDAPAPAASYLEFNVPTLWNNGLYVTHGRSLISAYDAHTGALRWRAKTGTLNNQASVADGLVFTTTWGNEAGAKNLVFAHRASNGRLVWRQTTDATATMYPATVADDRVFVGSDSGYVRAFEAHTGFPLWQHQFAGYISAPLVTTDGGVIVNSGLNTLSLLDEFVGQVRWNATLQAHDVVASNLVLAGKVLFFVSQDDQDEMYLTAYDATTGQRLLRSTDIVGAGGYADVTVAGGRVYVTSHGALVVYALN